MTANRCSRRGRPTASPDICRDVRRSAYDVHMPERAVWTVGHSNHDLDGFCALLKTERIEFVIDVRSYPYSRFAPQFDREELAVAMRARGTGYLFLGEALGGRPEAGDEYDADGHALYGPMAERSAFQAAIERVLNGAARYRLALMCSEGDPTDCHRRLLIGRVLTARGVELRHILADGRIKAELEVSLPGEGGAQSSLLPEEVPWRSTRSVSHRARLSASSAA